MQSGDGSDGEKKEHYKPFVEKTWERRAVHTKVKTREEETFQV